MCCVGRAAPQRSVGPEVECAVEVVLQPCPYHQAWQRRRNAMLEHNRAIPAKNGVH